MDKIFKLKGLMGKLFKHAPVDAAVDQLGKRLMYDALPPALEVAKNHFSAVQIYVLKTILHLILKYFMTNCNFQNSILGRNIFFGGKKFPNILVRGDIFSNILVRGEIH